MRLILPLLLAFFLLSRPAFAASIDDAQAALNRQDYKAAIKILQPLADDGDAEAQLFLGWMYRRGDGVTQNSTQAFKWLSRAAEQDNQYAQAAIGAMYAEGEGIKKDLIQAYKWVIIAEMSEETNDRTMEGFSKDLKDLAKEMPSADIDEARRMANEWTTGHKATKKDKSSPKLFLGVFLLPALCIASLPGRQRRFHYFYRAFTWIAFSVILFTPLFLVLSQAIPPQTPDAPSVKAISWAIVTALAFIYAGKRCSSERLSFLDGLMFVVASMSGIGSAVTTSAMVIVTVPLLVAIIVMSLLMSIFNDLMGRAKFTSMQYQKLIGFVVRHRVEL